MVLRADRRVVGTTRRPARRRGARDDGDDGARPCERRAREPVDELRLVSGLGPPARILRRGGHDRARQCGRRLHARLRAFACAAAGGGARARAGSRSGRHAISGRTHRARVASGQRLPRRHRAKDRADARVCRRLSGAATDRRRAALAPGGAHYRRSARNHGARVSKILVTGGAGFIGSGLVKALVAAGHRVRVLDDNSRGAPRRLSDVEKDIEFIAGDIRDAEAVARATAGMDEVHHLAFVNGTEFFYTQPDLVLDVGVRGMINVIDACRMHNVGNLILASSSVCYQTPPVVPTDETAPLSVPDVLNPRYSYGGGTLIRELMAINYGRKYFERVLIFRPHNVYGPDMGFEHVVPQFALRLKKLADAQAAGPLRFDIQGTGEETRAFCYIDDLVAGVMVMREAGEHLGIFLVGFLFVLSFVVVVCL